MTWTSTRQARELLASCAQEPPPRDNRTGTFNHPTPMFCRSDPRVRQLRRIYEAAVPTIDTPEWREWLKLTPQVAIRNAINNSTRTLEAAE